MKIRGADEQFCLNIVKNSINPAEDIDILCSNFSNHLIGITKNDAKILKEYIINASENPNLNDFPDFIFNKGFIEHFKVTSSLEKKGKGAQHIKDTSKFNKEIEQKEKDLKTKLENNEPTSGFSCEKEYCKHSYDYFIKSFKKNFENHLDSLSKYDGYTDVGIFMIEYMDLALKMRENKYKVLENLNEIPLISPIQKQMECLSDYYLSRDKNLLNYIYQYKDKLKYVIFVNSQTFEIIQINQIPLILELLPYDYSISVPGIINMYHTCSVISIPKN